MASRRAAQHVVASGIFQTSLHIACYLPFRHEFDTKPLIDLIWFLGKKCYLPVISSENMEFGAYSPDTRLKLNKFNILEPVVEIFFPKAQLDLVCMPLLAFDGRGHRLGMGGGFYDRTFEFLKHKTGKKPFLLGLGYDSQKAAHVPSDSWDVAMNGVLTDKKIYLF